MLKQRVMTAVALLAVLLPALFYPTPWPFCALTLVALVFGAWEWGRLNGASAQAAVFWALLCGALSVATWYGGFLDLPHPLIMLVGSAIWVLVGALLLQGGVSLWKRWPQSLRLMGGVLALWLAWVSIAQARIMGVNFLLSALLLVWVADIFAYFFGRTWGLKFTKSKLAPAISPGKTWEGVWGGFAGVVLLALIWSWADTRAHAQDLSLFSRLMTRGLLWVLIGAVFMTTMSVVGDLVESLVKRSVGAKDSSHLLPGHGGVLDRIDALLPTLPMALMLTQLGY